MLGFRRTVAVLLLLPLTLLVLLALAACRVDATLLDDEYLRDVAHDTDLYTLAYGDLVETWVDGYVEDPESLPDQMEAMGLPRDLDARARMVELVQSLVPLETLAATGDQAFGVVPWLVGKEDTFEVSVSLRQGVVATFGHAPGRPSLFQETWLEFDMGQRMVNGFILRAVAPPEPAPGQPAAEPRDPLTPVEVTALEDVLATQLPEAAAWWDTQLFAIIDAMLPYLTGDAEDFEVRIDFTEFPALADAFSGMLGEEADVLRREGWLFTEQDLVDRLRESRDVTIADIDNSLAILREGGMTFDQDDFVRRMDAQRLRDAQPSGEVAEGLPTDVITETSPGMSVSDLRDRASTGRLALRWGTVLAAAVLIAAVAVLGGRTWPSRIAWGTSALLAASTVAFALTTAVMSVLLNARLDRWIEQRTTEEGDSLGDLARARGADVVERAVQDIVGGMQAYALGWLALSMIALGLAVLWPRPAFQQAIRRLRGAPPGAPVP